MDKISDDEAGSKAGWWCVLHRVDTSAEALIEGGLIRHTNTHTPLGLEPELHAYLFDA